MKHRGRGTDVRGSYSAFVFESSRCKNVCSAIIISARLCERKHTVTRATWYSGWSVRYNLCLLCTVWVSCLPVPFFLTVIFRTMCPLLLARSLSLCLSPLLRFFLQSHLCVSPASSFTFTPDSRHLGTVMPKRSQRRPENESLFPSISPGPVSL